MEKAVVYVAGNPDAYPVEYYDARSGQYQGMIPELLRRFSQESAYEVRYYAPDRGDQRRQLAKNRQVDMVSRMDGEEPFQGQRGDGAAALEAVVNGRQVVYRLCPLDIAPEGLEEELADFFSAVTQEERAGTLLEAVRTASSPRQLRLEAVVLGLALAAALLAAVIVVLLRRQRRRLRRMDQGRETDRTTGIGNREYMARHAQTCLNDKNRVLYSMFFFYFDPEQVIAAVGPEGAGGFVQYVAAVLQAFTADVDILARMTDSGFGILRLCAGREESVQWLNSLMERLRNFTRSDGTSCICPVSAGVCPLTAEDRELNEIIYQSLRAAKTAEARGQAYLFCSDREMTSLADDKLLQADMGRGLKNGEFRIEIQFYVDAGTGRIAGGQVLSCWEHPERGLLPRERFAPLMDRENICRQLDESDLAQACAFLDGLRQQGVEDFFLCCRLSEATLSAGDFAQQCGALVEAYRFRRSQLILGLPEQAAAQTSEVVEQNVRALKALGLQMVLSGLGERTAALFSVRDYPFDGVVLAGELVERSGAAAGPAILGAMIRMGHELGISVLAEEVKTADQARLLHRLGCDMMRGDRLYPPLPLWEARKKLMEGVRKGGKVSV